ncbi:MAG TPA: ABC transporter ATP-binding protein [Pyrinomonadaceae bacterium]
MNEFLQVEGVTKRFGSRFALQDAGFSIHRGEVLGLIGPNGSGKTTLLECLAGLMPADAGTIRAGEHFLTHSVRKDTLFYLPDGISPWGEQTVKWALEFFEDLYGTPKQRLSDLLAPLRLAEILKSRIDSLSKGERKRTVLALGLLTPHPLLLLDEPFDGLDLRQTREVMTLLKSEARNNRTLLLSIHQLVDAGRVCDRLVLLSAGKVVAEGTLSELQTRAVLPDGGVEEIFLALT